MASSISELDVFLPLTFASHCSGSLVGWQFESWGCLLYFLLANRPGNGITIMRSIIICSTQNKFWLSVILKISRRRHCIRSKIIMPRQSWLKRTKKQTELFGPHRLPETCTQHRKSFSTGLHFFFFPFWQKAHLFAVSLGRGNSIWSLVFPLEWPLWPPMKTLRVFVQSVLAMLRDEAVLTSANASAKYL